MTNIEKINEKEHTDEKQEKMENTQINNEDNKKILESDQHNNENNTLGTIIVPKELKAGTYTIIETKSPAGENNSENQSKTIGDLLATVIGNTLAAVFVGTILFILYIMFLLIHDFIVSLF